MKKILCLALAVLTISGCSTGVQPVETVPETTPETTETIPVFVPVEMPEQLALKVSEEELITRYPWLSEYDKEVTTREVYVAEVLEEDRPEAYLVSRETSVDKVTLDTSDYMYALYLCSEYVNALETECPKLLTAITEWEDKYIPVAKDSDYGIVYGYPNVSCDYGYIPTEIAFVEHELAVLTDKVNPVEYNAYALEEHNWKPAEEQKDGGLKYLDGEDIKGTQLNKIKGDYGSTAHFGTWVFSEEATNSTAYQKLCAIKAEYPYVAALEKDWITWAYQWEYCWSGILTDESQESNYWGTVTFDDIICKVPSSSCPALETLVTENEDSAVLTAESFLPYNFYASYKYSAYKGTKVTIQRNPETKESIKEHLKAEGYLIYDPLVDTEYRAEDWVEKEYGAYYDATFKGKVTQHTPDMKYFLTELEEMPVEAFLSINKATKGAERVDFFFERNGVHYSVTFETTLDFANTRLRPTFVGAYQLYYDAVNGNLSFE